MFEQYRLHHVGVVLPDMAEVDAFMGTMGLVESYRGFVAPWSCWCIFTTPAAGAAIELVVPNGGPLAKFNKGASGVHHFAYEVEDIAAVTAWAEGKGMRMIEPVAIKGAGDFWCNFLSPASTRGINVEFVQPF